MKKNLLFVLLLAASTVAFAQEAQSSHRYTAEEVASMGTPVKYVPNRFCDNWEIAGTAGYVIMCENSLRKTDAATRRTMKFDTHKGRSMAFGLSLSYYF